MKRWEVVKGMQKGTYKPGDKFKVHYPDNNQYNAMIDDNECLVWIEDNLKHSLVHISSYNEDEWTLIKP